MATLLRKTMMRKKVLPVRRPHCTALQQRVTRLEPSMHTAKGRQNSVRAHMGKAELQGREVAEPASQEGGGEGEHPTSRRQDAAGVCVRPWGQSWGMPEWQLSLDLGEPRAPS